MNQLSLTHIKRKAAFEKFHKQNPNVFDEFLHKIVVLQNAGRKQYSARAIFEVIRWEKNINPRSKDEYKINNNHIPFYVRMFVDRFPGQKAFFRVRG